eukprot:6189094-Pleurochrysis_carterae.AAC.1
MQTEGVSRQSVCLQEIEKRSYEIKTRWWDCPESLSCAPPLVDDGRPEGEGVGGGGGDGVVQGRQRQAERGRVRRVAGRCTMPQRKGRVTFATG